MGGNLQLLLISVGVIVVALVTIGLIFTKLYRRATKEISFVKTGFGGPKVIKDGGALVLPILHDITWVSMRTLKLSVNLNKDKALITKDRMRVDVEANFYVRVAQNLNAIETAAQTLGTRTLSPEKLKELMLDKFVDAFRSVVSVMTMIGIHEQRSEFVQEVQKAVAEDLSKNGLELETVSLTSFDQTDPKYFNQETNAFDAEGHTKLTQQIETKKKERNAIEQEAQIEIQKKNMETAKRSLELEREEEYAKLEQERELSTRRASQEATIAKEQAESKQAAREAQIFSEQRIDQAAIESEREVGEKSIEKDKLLRQKEIAKDQELEQSEIEKSKIIEAAEIEKSKTIEAALIEKTKTLETSEVLKTKAIDLANQEKDIEVANKSKEQSEAQAAANDALAKAVESEEKVVTVRETEIANRAKSIELVEASQAAEKDAIKIKVAAEAEKQVALDKAEATTTVANANAECIMVEAKAASDAEMVKADAREKSYKVDAKGKEELNKAENLLSKELIDMHIKETVIKALPAIITEAVRPMSAIDGVKMIQVNGLTGQAATDGGAPTGGNMSDQFVNSMLRYKAQAPLLANIMESVGIDSEAGINGFTKVLTEQFPGGNVEGLKSKTS